MSALLDVSSDIARPSNTTKMPTARSQKSCDLPHIDATTASPTEEDAIPLSAVETSEGKVTPPTESLKNAVVGDLWLSIDEEIAASGGSTYGIITKLIDINKWQFPWLTRNMVNYCRTKAVKELKLPQKRSGRVMNHAYLGLQVVLWREPQRIVVLSREPQRILKIMAKISVCPKKTKAADQWVQLFHTKRVVGSACHAVLIQPLSLSLSLSRLLFVLPTTGDTNNCASTVSTPDPSF